MIRACFPPRSARVLLLAAALSLPLTSTPIPARAATPASTQGDAGVYAAMACGLGLRFLPLLAAWAPAVAGVATACAFMMVEALSTPDD